MLFFAYAMFAAVDWLYSMIPVRFPDIKICLSEGGIGWVAGAARPARPHARATTTMYGTWDGIELTPAEVLQRNFWFCAVEDPSAFALRDRIGVDHILLEADYPHCDSTVAAHPGGHRRGDRRACPAEDIRKITWENASKLYRHPVPAVGASTTRRASAPTAAVPFPPEVVADHTARGWWGTDTLSDMVRRRALAPRT